MTRITRKARKGKKAKKDSAVAVFHTAGVQGEVVATPCRGGIDLVAVFHRLPPGEHGFHIHKAGDMRQKDCMGLCEHYDKGHHHHGSGPGPLRGKGKGKGKGRERHTGDLGNIQQRNKTKKVRKVYCLHNVSVRDLWGRSIIVHEGKDDLGLGPHEDSHTTGHSGARMACAIFGRTC